MRKIIIALVVLFSITNLSFSQNETHFSAEWKNADSLVKNGLPKSALEVVEKIYQSSKKEKIDADLIKSIIYKIGLTSQYQENSLVESIKILQEETKNSSQKVKPLLYVLSGELYWAYYSANRWQIKQRSETINYENNDIETWTEKQILREVVSSYKNALSDPQIIFNINIEPYKIILENTEYIEYCPTMLDLISYFALRRLDNEIETDKPAKVFDISNKKYFSPAHEFATIKIPDYDTTSHKWIRLNIYQTLMSFHLADNDKKIATFIDLNRLRYVWEESTLPNKDSLYHSALLFMHKSNEGEAWAESGYALAEYYFQRGEKYNTNEGKEYQWDYKESLNYINSILPKYQKTISGNNCQVLEENIKAKTLSLNIEKTNIPGEKFEGVISYKNVDNAYIAVKKLSYNDYEKNIKSAKNNKEALKYLNSLKNEKTYLKNLKNIGDFQEHTTNIVFDELPAGLYVALISSGENFDPKTDIITYSTFWTSNISYITQQNGEEYSFYILDRNSGQAIENAKVKFYIEKYDRNSRKSNTKNCGQAISNAEGLVGPIKIESGNSQIYLDIENNEDRYNPNISHYNNYYKNNSSKECKRVHLFTDRSIYRPGQVIHYKGLFIDCSEKNNNKIIAGANLIIALDDLNGQTISQKEVTSNDFGSFSGEFTIPESGINGNMVIRTAYGSKTISVEEYKQPKFFVEINSPQGNYKLNDEIHISGQAIGYSGNNIDNAEYKYRVTRRISYPYRWWQTSNIESQISNGEGKTDENGKFNFDFTAYPDNSISPTLNPIFHYEVFVDVCDLNGETRSGHLQFNVSEKSMILNANINSILSSAEKNIIEVKAENINGQSIHTNIKVEIFEIENPEGIYRSRILPETDFNTLSKTEYKQIFPFDKYYNENEIESLKTGNKIFEKTFNTSKDSTFSINEIIKNKQGKFLIKLSSTDSQNNNIENEIYFDYINLKSKKTYAKTSLSVYFQEKNYEPGETAKLLLSSFEKNTKVYVQLGKDNKILESKWITLNEEQKIIEFPIKEEYRGNVWLNVFSVKHNRILSESYTIDVPFTNKELYFDISSFRNKLLPGEDEKWKITIKNHEGEGELAELLASMYDTSLDSYKSHNWFFNILSYSGLTLKWSSERIFEKATSKNCGKSNTYKFYIKEIQAPELISLLSTYRYNTRFSGSKTMYSAKGDIMVYDDAVATNSNSQESNIAESILEEESIEEPKKIESTTEFSDVESRKNFNETAFFMPHLQSNANGELEIEFTMPESLSKWKFMGFAHTKDLKYRQIEKYITTQKILSISTFAPRFLRTGDTVLFSAKINNLHEAQLQGSVILELKNPITGASVENNFKLKNAVQKFSVEAGQSTNVSWEIIIPEGFKLLTYSVKAKANNFSDGEENTIPILSNKILVTESLPLPIKGKQQKTFTFNKLKNSNSTSISNYAYTIEFTSDPIWTVIQALPFMSEGTNENSIQTFTRYYANAIATKIANDNPQIKEVFAKWNDTNAEALLSNLEKNQELKSILLEETPWLLETKNESDRKRRIKLLFDVNRMSNDLEKAQNKLSESQLTSGAFAWFKGMDESRYITQLIVSGFGKLNKIGIENVKSNSKSMKIIKNAITYMDNKATLEFDELNKIYKNDINKKNRLSYIDIQYLYARSFWPDIKIPTKAKPAYDFYHEQAKQYWTSFNLYAQAMIALTMNRSENEKAALNIIKSFREKSLSSDELGMYWKDIENGYNWWTASIEGQSLMIEAFDEIANDNSAIEEMKIHLLKQKQVQDWGTSRATADACYAILKGKTDNISNNKIAEISVGKEIISPSDEKDFEAGTGYFKKTWNSNEITTDMSEISVTNFNEDIAWGAAYWQYFDDLDKVTAANTQLKINKKLFVERQTPTGNKIEPVNEGTNLVIGDKIVTRIEIRTDRDLEYVHLKDLRASCMEPTNVLSRTKYQDGLYYYESTLDVSSNFFFDNLPKGVYVFEYSSRITHSGNFSSGIANIQCMYAPEFSSHSEGIRITIK